MILGRTNPNQPIQADVATGTTDPLLRSAFEHSPVGIALVSIDGFYLKANHRLCEILGYTETELLSKRTSEVTHPDDTPTNWEQRSQLLGGEITESAVEKRYLHRSGRVIWAQRVTALLRDSQGKPLYFVTQVQDITQRREAEEKLATAHARLVNWLAELETHTHEMDLLNKLVALLQTCQTVDEAYAIVSKIAPALFPGDSGMLAMSTTSLSRVKIVAVWGKFDMTFTEFERHDCWALRMVKPHVVLEGQHSLACRHLESIPPAYLCVPLAAQSEVLGCLHLSTLAGQLSEHKQQLCKTVADSIALSLANLRLRETLRQQSIMDALTGLFNRRYMEEALEKEICLALRDDYPLSLMMLDIDHFKSVNDSYGHAAGDYLLHELASFLLAHIRSEDIACRFGGEEFALILPNSDLATTHKFAELIQEKIQELTLTYQGQVIGPVTLSIGISVFPIHGRTSALILRSADNVLYKSKRNGRNRITVAR